MVKDSRTIVLGRGRAACASGCCCSDAVLSVATFFIPVAAGRFGCGCGEGFGAGVDEAEGFGFGVGASAGLGVGVVDDNRLGVGVTVGVGDDKGMDVDVGVGPGLIAAVSGADSRLGKKPMTAVPIETTAAIAANHRVVFDKR